MQAHNTADLPGKFPHLGGGLSVVLDYGSGGSNTTVASAQVSAFPAHPLQLPHRPSTACRAALSLGDVAVWWMCFAPHEFCLARG